jgi:catechol 2,3-dioxygenase-like lactoylglutathione lyase family enzyme
MLQHVGGIDHCVALVRDLDAAAATYARLGFTVAPRGIHSAHMGTGNNCVMLERDYFELLGVLAPTEANAKWRGVLAEREGMTAIALRAHDAEQGAAELAARGVATLPVMRFGRPVAMPDGSRTETRFQTFHIQDPPAPGLRLFACQHLTPEATWVPGSMAHANTATGLAEIEVLAVDPAAAAAAVGRVLDRAAEAHPDGSVRLPTGAAPLAFLTAAQLAARHPGIDLAGLPVEGPVTLAVTVRDAAAAARAVAAAGVPFGQGPGGLSVPPAAAHGVILAFRQG